ncbi:hypothetical protein [Streptomyces chrestomyceticus]|uniref:hypothetical protein n=1 Tax=Streptomyces chrestomyceticus TaxID=68185 RepID=UPI0037ADFD8D
MAFYLVTDGRKNEFGEADTFVVRAGGVRLAASIAPLADRKNAEVVKLQDGRDVQNGVILSALVDYNVGLTAATDYDSQLVESEVDESGYTVI